jgi:hypothetical protein
LAVTTCICFFTLQAVSEIAADKTEAARMARLMVGLSLANATTPGLYLKMLTGTAGLKRTLPDA